MLPIGLILLLLTGIGPLLAWRKSTRANLVEQFLWPSVAAVVTGGGALRVRRSRLGLGHVLRAVRVRRRPRCCRSSSAARSVRKGATGSDIVTAMIGLVGRSRRRYGGYIVHLGIMLMFLGFAGQGFKQEEQVKLKRRAAGNRRAVHRPPRCAAASPATRRSR